MIREDQLLNRSEIIRMAREAGFEELFKDSHDWVCFTEEIERFAALVSKQERGLDFNQGYKQAIKDCVVLLMIQHEMAKGSHNYWHVAANLIQAEYGVQHDD